MIEMPPGWTRWHTHGYYGSANHNVKAIYQRYLGWYDGNPAHLWQHPPEAAATRYVEAIGGVDATVAKARDYFEQGDLRFAAELASHAVFAAPDNEAARELLAWSLSGWVMGRRTPLGGTATLPGHGAADGRDRAHRLSRRVWRRRSRSPSSSTRSRSASTDRGVERAVSINWHFTDANEHYRMELSNGALIHYPTSDDHRQI